MNLIINHEHIALASVLSLSFGRQKLSGVEWTKDTISRIRASHLHLVRLCESKIPIYGVNTGFGDSGHREVHADDAELLQHNLISYLCCGSGAQMSLESTRATMLIRLQSLSRGFSGVSENLLMRLSDFIRAEIIPIVPLEGSLGASGDLIPLAYIALTLEGRGDVIYKGQKISAREACHRCGLEMEYKLGPKEGLALVNGTSAMAGIACELMQRFSVLLDRATIASAWALMSVCGKIEAWDSLVNSEAKKHLGQTKIAQMILALVQAENMSESHSQGELQSQHVQDRYSLRCVPQILGPVLESLELAVKWLETEINSTSDNPLIDPETGTYAHGGNFYGGYLGHAMDYLKISAAHVADLLDRQLMLVMSEQTNRGLPPNLANWPGIAPSKRHANHGLKALHQSVNALTSEICALAHPVTIHSRSSELHNQDKVSLGMSAATSFLTMIEKLETLLTLDLVCLAQALDLRGIKLRGEKSQQLYTQIRRHVAFAHQDCVMHDSLLSLRDDWRRAALEREPLFCKQWD